MNAAAMICESKHEATATRHGAKQVGGKGWQQVHRQSKQRKRQVLISHTVGQSDVDKRNGLIVRTCIWAINMHHNIPATKAAQEPN